MSGDAEKSTLDKWLARKKESKKEGIAKKPSDQPAVLSHGQERLWLLEQLYSDQNLYSYGHHYKIEGPLDCELLISSFHHVVQKHEVLRSTYREMDASVRQKVHQSFEIPITYISSESDKGKQVEKFLNAPFHLEKDLPIRLCIHNIDSTTTEVFLALHHIAGDAWSMNVINTEVSTHYKQSINSPSNTVEDLSIQYQDFAFHQRNQSVEKEDLSYWKEKLKDETGELKLPFRAEKEPSFKGKWLRRTLPADLVAQIERNAKASKVTMYAYWLTVFKLFLTKYSNQTSLAIGSPFSNRDKKELEALVGFFNETLVLKSNFEGDPTFTSAAEKVGKTVLEALAHKNVPFETLVNELNPDRGVGENPLFKAMFLYNDEPTPLALPKLSISEEVIDMGVSKFDLTLFVNKRAGQVELVFEHTDRFDDSVIISMMDHLAVFLGNIAESPNKKISELTVLSSSEIDLITKEWNATKTEIPSSDNIVSFIAAHERSNPSSVAIAFKDQSISYEQLGKWSNSVASNLVDFGVQPGEFVGIYAQRSVEMIAAIVGILKAGAAYLPLDPNYPQQRLNYMVSDSKTRLVLVAPTLGDASFEVESLLIERTEREERVSIQRKPTKNAYIIYTSGSTGKPKGVPVSHQNLIQSTTARYSFYEREMKSFLLLSSFSFDSSVVGIFWSLCSGGTLVMPPDRIEQDLNLLTETIRKNQVTHTLMLPSLYQVLLSYAEVSQLQSLTTIMVAGEAVSQQLRIDHFDKLPAARLYNEYGPTEATVWCVAHEIRQDESGAIPIGKPIPNTQAYVLDRHLNPVPVGVEGELFIGGGSVTDGYLKNPDLTAQKFFSNPFGKGSIYATGDLAKWRNNGLLDFIGRIDSQIKIRGQRVEVEEIKQVFLEIAEVKKVEIKVDGAEKKRIVAYVRSRDDLKESALLNAARKKLPDHMIPAHVVVMSSFPTLPNGKIDISQFPLPTESKPEEKVEPSTELEQQLAQIWSEVLNVRPIGIHDNFFDIGGDSIRSIQVVAKARKEGIGLEPTAIFKHQTIALLTASLAEDRQESWSAIIPMKTSGSAPPLFCIHSGGAHVMFYKDFAKEIGEEHPVYAIQPKGLDSNQDYHKSISEMASHYIEEIKKVQSSGPYHLLGTCFSNAVGLDMIHQLKAQGDEVAVMYVVDSAPAFLTPPSPNGERMPVRRMAKMVKDGNWGGIYKKFRNRFILANRKLNAGRTSEVQKDLYEMIGSLNELYSRYSWKSIDANVVLIRSSEFASRAGKQFHLDHWKLLSHGNLKTYEVTGHHKTLFQQPEVKGLATQISEHKSQLRKKLLDES